MLEVIVAPHRLVHAEGPDEGDGRRGHAMAGVRIEVVGAEARPHQLRRGVALENRPLSRAEHADRVRAFLLQHALELTCHLVEGAIPRHGLELAVLSELPVPHAEQRLGQPVDAVHDLRQEVALDAVEAPIDLRLHVTVGSDDLSILDADHDAAAGAAEAAGRLGPLQLDVGAGREILRRRGQANVRRRGGSGGGLCLDERTSREIHRRHPCFAAASVSAAASKW